MKQYLKDISSPVTNNQCYSKFDDYIDVCKNLSILHTLLSESLTKIVPDSRTEKLQRILDGITAHLSQPMSTMTPYSRQLSLQNQHTNEIAVNSHRSAESDRPGYQSLQRNVFRFNDPTAGNVSNNATSTHTSLTDVGNHQSPKASTLPRNTHLMAPPVSSTALSAPGRRTAIDLTTSDDYVMFSALNQSADHRVPRTAKNTFGTTYSAGNVKNGLTRYERILGLGQTKNNSTSTTSINNTNNGNLEEFIDSLQYVDESPDAHSGGEGDNNTQGSQVSISQLSTVASSGYQSFAYSQSSSPVDPTINHDANSGNSSSGSFRQNCSTATNNNANNNKTAAIAFTNPVYNMRKSHLPVRTYTTGHSYNSVLNSPPSSEDIRVVNVPRVALISNGSPNNNSLSSGNTSRPRMSSSSSDSTSCVTPPSHDRRMFMSTAPRTNPRCVYSSPVPQQTSPPPPGAKPESISESTYARRKSRKANNITTSRNRIYDSSSSDSDFEPSARFRERNPKRGSKNALDRCSNPKSLDEVIFFLLAFRPILSESSCSEFTC